MGKSDGALPATAGEAGEVGNAGELGMTPEIAAHIADAEAKTRVFLKAAPVVRMRIPRGIFAPTARVSYNGVAMELGVGVDIDVPAPVAELLQTRIDAELEREELARASARGG